MGKVIGVLVLVVFVMASSGISFAGESGEAEGSKMEKHEKMGKDHGMMMKKMMMMDRQMIATKDGGVVVLVGNKLMKYDKKLNLIGEAEIKMDMEGMMEKMKECREMMKMHGVEEESSE